MAETRHKLDQGLYTRHLKTVVVGLVLATLLTLVLYTTPTTTSFILSATTNSLSASVLMDEGGPRCLPHRHVMFLKTHKCASTTVQNIFLRYGYTHNLTFALPSVGNYLGNPRLFKADMIPNKLLPLHGVVDLFAVHSRLNPPEHKRILYNDTRWITIVREPATLYESLFNFFHMKNGYGFDLSQFSTRPMLELESLPRYGGKLGKNQMLFDLGYSDNMSVTELRSAIEQLDKRFDLVMISEYMDESLVLLRHLLCWSLHDVVVFAKNARRQEVKPTLEPRTLQALRELNSADVLLYNHFVAKHRRSVYEFGVQRMANEVSALRSLRDEYYEVCGAREVKGRDSSLKFKEYSGLVSGYVTANNSDQNCLMLSMPELPLVDTIRRRQKVLLNVDGLS
ncbi:galactose-3-O-sulfotransferase 4-like isoform X2 [Homarus americanus]|uniref:galactose-3-O-sulfotransferase 4-like isoform X2 n=1 Tax=Homarus americanus TaxID=6706 RepID=UPI001C46EFDC|nr:galactose-3-O-sulfotransferase 4-like isoform X2 [Homarus americanus]